MFVYDLMKTDWESRVPHVEAIELNIDIIMSSSPLYTTSQSLLNLIRVEKARKKCWNFQWLQNKVWVEPNGLIQSQFRISKNSNFWKKIQAIVFCIKIMPSNKISVHMTILEPRYFCRFLGSRIVLWAENFIWRHHFWCENRWPQKFSKFRKFSIISELSLNSANGSSTIIHVEIIILNVSFAYVIILIVQELLKHKHFRGQLNVTIRFAHPYGWDAKDPIVKEEIHTG